MHIKTNIIEDYFNINKKDPNLYTFLLKNNLIFTFKYSEKSDDDNINLLCHDVFVVLLINLCSIIQ